MSGDITMVQVVEALSETYTSDGVAIYLGAHVTTFDGERPIDVCRTAEGRFRVWVHAQSLADGVMG
jgi:hypothetical protein